MKNNFVRKHMHTTCKPQIVPQKQCKLKSKATLREMSETLLDDAVEPKTITFESGSVIWWDESEDGCKGCMNSVGCSSIEIDCEEDEK